MALRQSALLPTLPVTAVIHIIHTQSSTFLSFPHHLDWPTHPHSCSAFIWTSLPISSRIPAFLISLYKYQLTSFVPSLSQAVCTMSCSLAPSCFSVYPQTCYLSVYWTFWLLPAAWWICLPVWSAFSGFDPCLSQHPGNLRTPILLNCNSLAWNICLSLLPLFFWELTTEFISAEAFCKLWVTRGFLWIKEGPDIQTMWTTSVYQCVCLFHCHKLHQIWCFYCQILTHTQLKGLHQ